MISQGFARQSKLALSSKHLIEKVCVVCQLWYGAVQVRINAPKQCTAYWMNSMRTYKLSENCIFGDGTISTITSMVSFSLPS